VKTYYSRVAGVRRRGKTFSLESRGVRMRLNTLTAAFLGAMFLLALVGCGRFKTQTEAHPATPPTPNQPTQRQSDAAAEKTARTNSAAALPALQAEHKEGSGPSPCQLTFAEVEIIPGEADVTLEIIWKKDVPPLRQGDVTVAFVFAPEPFPLRSDLFKLNRNYSFGFAVLSRDSESKSKNPPELLKMVSGLTITDKGGIRKRVRTIFQP
jgi:hypothetical protein